MLSPRPRRGEVRSIDDDFAIIATPLECGEVPTEEQYEAALRIVRAYWPKGGRPHELPEKWR
ncbi:hypothetical protein ACQPXB_35785 [Amycolatopsis sp. CA-161197]|uniref:hypothetical protein n=1 Tax=Amycolatopsis sp. CA-161197 TaxID=3239922 RepID=UPI003D8F9041